MNSREKEHDKKGKYYPGIFGIICFVLLAFQTAVFLLFSFTKNE
jgi:hypothetical protein